MNTPDISVVVPTLRRRDALEGCLAALVAQDFEGKRFEIVVADAGEEAAVRQIVGRWAMLTRGAPLIRYVPAGAARGPAGARNLGRQGAKGDVIDSQFNLAQGGDHRGSAGEVLLKMWRDELIHPVYQTPAVKIAALQLDDQSGVRLGSVVL